MALPAGMCFCRLLIVFGVLRICDAVQVTLLDTAKLERLEWETHQSQASDNQRNQGWREATFNAPGGDTVRIYTVCRVTSSHVENWLRTPFIARGAAKRLYVEVRFTLRRCTAYPDPQRLQQCKETFQLLVDDTDDETDGDADAFNVSRYRPVDVIAAERPYTERGSELENVETQGVAVSRRGAYFAFLDTGACITFLRIRIYYEQCSEVTHNFALFANTTTGPEKASFAQTSGVCVAHAAIAQTPLFICGGDGAWKLPSGGCKCMPGYEPTTNRSACAECPLGRYKWRTGSQPCQTCPVHSDASETGAVECHCVDGYYRNINDDKSMACTKPPSLVLNLTVTYHDQSMVNLSWQQPSDLGGRRDLTYSVDCVSVGGVGRVTYRPHQAQFNTTRVSLLGLEPATNYKVIVSVHNGVSEQSRGPLSAHLIVRTDAALPSRVRRLRVLSVGREHVALAWDAPQPANSPIDKYEVKYHVGGATANATSAYTRWRNITLGGLEQSSRYEFMVRGKTAKGWGEFSTVLSATTGQLVERREMKKVDERADSQVGIIAGAAVAVLVCMVIVIIMVVIFIRRYRAAERKRFSRWRNHRSCHDKNMSDCDNLQYPNVSQDDRQLPEAETTHPLCSTAERAAHKIYIDPHTYEDPNQAVREFAKEINSSLITIEFVIGGGEFGDVCKGKLQLKTAALTVAIKTLKAGASSKNRLDFLTEASIMGQFDDPNVIFLVGVVTKMDPIMIITEYMENGSLDEFLKKNPSAFMMIQLVGMLRGIASGCRHLTDMHYVHRDLAARNILVNENLVCKVSDFGLSREIESDNIDGAYTAKGGKIPVRWTAPEAIAFRKFTSASDVWSFGVVAWEVLSYGGRPYGAWTNQEVIKAIDGGYRLLPPQACPEAVYQLMLDCWQKEPTSRPKFISIVHCLDCLVHAPDSLRALAKPARSPVYMSLLGVDGVSQWLAAAGLPQYAPAFERAGVLSMQRVAGLAPADLYALGVMLPAHQQTILSEVQQLRVQLGGATGCLV